MKPFTAYQVEFVVEQPDIEDGGQAMITQDPSDTPGPFFVRLQSWDESRQHDLMRQLVGRKVRVTVEIIE